MKALKVLLIAAAAAIFSSHVQAASLGNGNGLKAGAALLSLYTQYKSTGKLDLTNATNLNSLLTLASNIKGLDQLTDKASFLTGLISGSKNLVNKGNSNSVLGSLTQLSGLDLSSLSASSASSAVNGALSKIATTGATKTGDTTASVTSAAGSILTGLFKKL
ncbi:MAG: hypothetical protein IJS62_02650 [Bacteroidales bacterium]|nr:hypothetical protein [Bacteroidales bacterium]